jgi:DNA-binding MarR family transcriptional regulator
MYVYTSQVRRPFLTREASITLDLQGTGQCAAFNFRRAARAVTRLYDQALEPSGVRSTQFAILVAVKKGELTPVGELGRVLGIDSTTMTRSLRLLTKQGLLAVSHRREKRQRFVSMTARGEEVLARAIPVWREMQARFVNTIGEPYWRELRGELERLALVASSLVEGR